jgi:REP element-mobilizing transposase RayT
MITRRCSERRCFLRPDPETNNAFIYCLALAATRANVQVLFACAMSDHHHIGIYDCDGRFPDFIEHLHALFARCQNVHLGRFESLWSSAPTSIVELVNPEDVLAKTAYALANPMAAGLVDTAEEWPGVNSFHAMLANQPLTATRPKHFFRPKGGQPNAIALPITRPRAFADLPQDEWADLVSGRVRVAEAEHRQQRAQAGRQVLGREAVLAEDPFASPKTEAPRFNLSPRVAAKGKEPRIRALRLKNGFLAKYLAAFKNHRAGVAHVLFPFGTWWMRKFVGVACETAEMASEVMPALAAAPA